MIVARCMLLSIKFSIKGRKGGWTSPEFWRSYWHPFIFIINMPLKDLASFYCVWYPSSLLPLDNICSTVPLVIQAVISGCCSKGLSGCLFPSSSCTPYTNGNLRVRKLSGGKITWHPRLNCNFCSRSGIDGGRHDVYKDK